jgi:hypothetical protein
VQLGVELHGATAIHDYGQARREGVGEVALSAGCSAARAATRFLTARWHRWLRLSRIMGEDWPESSPSAGVKALDAPAESRPNVI